jgi:hypothetical protein
MGNLDAMSAPDRPLGLVVGALRVMLHFLYALPGNDVFAPVADPEQLFAAMRRELPDLTPSDLAFASGVANQLGRQLRQVSWRLRGGSGKPKSAEPRPRRVGARRFKPDDPKLLALPVVIGCWRAHIGLKTAWKVKDVIRRAKDLPDFGAALMRVASDGNGITSHRLGLWLSRVEGLAIDGMALRCAEVKFGYPRWTLIEVPPA